MSGLKPEVSLGVGLAVAAIVGAVYMNATPTLAEVRVGRPGDDDLEASRKVAAWTSGGVVAAISLLAKDPTVFIIGGGMTVALDWWYRHANQVDPRSGRASAGGMLAAAGGAETPAMAPEGYGYGDDVQVGY